jgi:hypothetical protein
MAFWSDDHRLMEVSLYDRRHARLTGFPACFVQTQNLYQEVRDADASDRPVDAEPAEFGSATFAVVIGKDRQCPDWFRFQPGRSLAQHLDDKIQMELELQRESLQVRLAEMERDSRATSERIEADSLEIARALKSFTTRWTYIAAGLAFAVLVVTLLIWLGVKA